MKKIRLLLITALLVIPWLSFAQEVKVNVTFETPQVQNAGSDNYVSVVANDMLMGIEEGLPDIPFRYLRIIIPSASQATSVSVNKLEEQTFQLNKDIQPAQAPVPIGFGGNPEIISGNISVYSSDDPFPVEMAEILNTENFNGNKVVTIKISPFQYHPASNRLKFYSRLEVSLRYSGGTINKKQSLALIGSNAKNSFMTNEMLRDFVNNKDDFDRFAVKSMETASATSINRAVQNGLGSEYVIITSEALAPAFERFANWKTSKQIIQEI